MCKLQLFQFILKLAGGERLKLKGILEGIFLLVGLYYCFMQAVIALTLLLRQLVVQILYPCFQPGSLLL